ncbi:glycosyltransferase family 2 protein [Mariniflexile sp. AS56]|uniref:glycosyltransferase family 2 protein n=1 Tax=Mariniflexile sp. AS56 TaxID=3063957 RepID=UPI0026EAB50C|nr:glycosyltransferase family 2 protein [Mariniflexile sp. AS56]MDO7172731.1 glycosyltransferase family 2 protein [Mariniflexile sp. AS56]
MSFFVSVVIPVYNCEQFIEKAITSVLDQPEVHEIVVVNDGSVDKTAQILEKLQAQYPIIKVYSHSNYSNKGRSASRNLGIENVTMDYIAFLDADDFYLPERFKNDQSIFLNNSECDGIYNAVGFHFYRNSTIAEQEKYKLYTVTQEIKPEQLFESLLYGKHGHFHINGLTVKKSVFEATGYFNEALVVAEDTDIFWKLALKCRLHTGVIDRPLAIRGVHEDNVFENVDLYRKYTIKMYQSMVIWSSENQVPSYRVDDLLKWVWILKHKEQNKLYTDIGYWARHFFPYPKLLFSVLSIKYFPVIRLRKKLFPFLYKQ